MSEDLTIAKIYVCDAGDDHIQRDIHNSVSADQFRYGTELAKNAVFNALKEQLKESAQEGTLDKDDATSIYNAVATRIGYGTIDSVGGAYTVRIQHEGYDVFIARDIEADSEEEAIEYVRDNTSVSVEVTVEYNYDTETFSGDEDSIYLEYEAEEQ